MRVEASSVPLQEYDGVQKRKVETGGFEKLLLESIADVNSDLHAAKAAQEALLDGKVENMIELMATIEKADISLRFATEVRNKAIEAYQEIMRMQV